MANKKTATEGRRDMREELLTVAGDALETAEKEAQGSLEKIERKSTLACQSAEDVVLEKEDVLKALENEFKGKLKTAREEIWTAKENSETVRKTANSDCKAAKKKAKQDIGEARREITGAFLDASGAGMWRSFSHGSGRCYAAIGNRLKKVFFIGAAKDGTSPEGEASASQPDKKPENSAVEKPLLPTETPSATPSVS